VLTSTGTAPQWSSGLTIARPLSTNSATISTVSTSKANVFNTNARAVDIGGDAASISIGSSSASETLTTNIKNYTTGGTSSTTVSAQIGFTATISTVARNGSNVATLATTANHGLTTGDTVTIVCSDAGFNTVNASVTVTGLTTFTYANTGGTVTTTAASGSVYIGAIGAALSATAANGTIELSVASTSNIRTGMLVQGVNILAGTTVAGVDASRVYLSSATTGTIGATNIVAFTNTNASLGIKPGDQITIASSGDANINGTWPITNAGATSTTFNFKITTSTTQSNLARAGTIVKESTFLIRNRNVTIGSSEASASPVAAVIKGENGVGTNTAGAAFTVRPGLSTGNATGGVINFQTGTTGTTGDTTQTAITRMTLEESLSASSIDLTTSMTTVRLFTTNAATVSAFGAASSLSLAHLGTGTRTVNIATGATGGASTLTFGGAVTGNTFEINSVAGGTVNLTSDVTTGIINLYTGTTTGTINIGSASSTVEMGTVELNNQLSINSSETTGVTTSSVAVSTFAAATYRSAKYTLQVECTSGTDVGKYQVSEILILHDGTTATMTDYAVIRTGNNLVTFTADINGGNVRLLAAATTGNTVKVRVVRYLNTI
jgi:hypothetical protein